jgi:uncharacterized membrane protein
VIALLLGLGAAAWVVLLVTAPVAPDWLGAGVYALGSLVCHQIPERSFFLGGFQLPVCARCLALYAGVLPGVAMHARPGRAEVLRSSARARQKLVMIAAVPTLATVVLESVGAWSPSNATRAMAAVPVAWAVGFVVAGASSTLHYDRWQPLRRGATHRSRPST